MHKRINYHISEIIHLLGDSDNYPSDFNQILLSICQVAEDGGNISIDEIIDILEYLPFDYKGDKHYGIKN